MLKLYSYYRSSAAYRVRIALNLKGVPYEMVTRHLLRDGGEQRRRDYLDLNPQGLVPALDDDGQVLAQSLAIIEYLEERYPKPALLPEDPVDRAHVRQMALAVACDLHPLNNLRVLNFLRGPMGQQQEAVNRWYNHWIEEGLRPLEELVNRYSGDGLHCFGTTITLADICLVPQIFNAHRFKCDVSPYPTLVAVSSHLEQNPAFDAARPEKQPDAE